jgi:hypothetical protein
MAASLVYCETGSFGLSVQRLCALNVPFSHESKRNIL